MIKKTKIFLVGIIAFLIAPGCKEKEVTSSRYYNTYDTLAIHFIDLKSDSSFYHYYEKDTVRLVNTGVWSKKTKNRIWLDEWIVFGVIEDESCLDGCIKGIQENGKELVFSYDLRQELNFYKE